MLYKEPRSRLAISQPPRLITSDPLRYVVGTPKVSSYEFDHALRTRKYPSVKEDVAVGSVVALLGGMFTAFAVMAGFSVDDARTTAGTVWLIILATVLGAVALFIGLLVYECVASIYQEKRVQRATGKGVTVIDADDVRWQTLRKNLGAYAKKQFVEDDLWPRVENALTKQSGLTTIVKIPVDEYLTQTAEAANMYHHTEVTDADRNALQQRITNRAIKLRELLVREFKEYDQPILDAASRQAAEDEAIKAGELARAEFLREQAKRDAALNVKRILDDMDAEL